MNCYITLPVIFIPFYNKGSFPHETISQFESKEPQQPSQPTWAGMRLGSSRAQKGIFHLWTTPSQDFFPEERNSNTHTNHGTTIHFWELSRKKAILSGLDIVKVLILETVTACHQQPSAPKWA